MTQLTYEAIAGLVYATGLRGEPAAIAVAITDPESSRDPNKINNNKRTQDLSYGLWQINLFGDLGPPRRKKYVRFSDSELLSPQVNARAMYDISRGGTYFNAWTGSYKKGLHRATLGPARAAVAAVEARGGVVGGSSAGSLAAGTPGPIAGEVRPPGGGLAASFIIDNSFPGIKIPGGDGLAARTLGVDGSTNLSVNSVSEMTLTFISPRTRNVWADFLIGTEMRIYGVSWVVTDLEWGDRDGVEALTATLHPTGVEKMRRPIRAQTWNNSSPTQVLASLAQAAGLRFYGKGTAQRSQIVQLDADASQGRDVAESDWELGERLAREEGFWWFEAGGAVYFAPPSWLRDSTTRFPVRNVSGSIYDAAGRVQASITVNAVRTAIVDAREITFDLPRWRGEQVLPGMVVDYAGTPGFDGQLLVVTDVSWPLDGGVTPARITASTPIDPTPQPAQDDSALIGAGDMSNHDPGDSESEDNFRFRELPAIANDRSHTYGYQYDAPKGDSGHAQPGTEVLRSVIRRRFPKSTDSGLYVRKKVDGTSEYSAHAEGRAYDAGVPVSSQLGRDIANFLVANAPLYGIQYVIWDGKQWTATKRSDGWRTYKPPNGKKDVTSMHRDHVHMEQCWEAAKNFTEAQALGAVNG